MDETTCEQCQQQRIAKKRHGRVGRRRSWAGGLWLTVRFRIQEAGAGVIPHLASRRFIGTGRLDGPANQTQELVNGHVGTESQRIVRARGAGDVAAARLFGVGRRTGG